MYHCLDDDKLKKNKYSERNIKLLYMLKDADALDRVRNNDLDENYLRCEYSKKLIIFSKSLFKENIDAFNENILKLSK